MWSSFLISVLFITWKVLTFITGVLSSGILSVVVIRSSTLSPASRVRSVIVSGKVVSGILSVADSTVQFLSFSVSSIMISTSPKYISFSAPVELHSENSFVGLIIWEIIILLRAAVN